MLPRGTKTGPARKTTEQQISLFATERSRLSSKQQNGQTSWFGAAPLFRDWRRPGSLT